MIPTTSSNDAPALLQEEEYLKYYDSTSDDNTASTSTSYDSDDSSSWDSSDDEGDEQLVNEIKQQMSFKNMHLILNTAKAGNSNKAPTAMAPPPAALLDMQEIQSRMNKKNQASGKVSVYIQSTGSATGVAGAAAGAVDASSTPQGQLDAMLQEIKTPFKSFSDNQWRKHFLPVTQDRIDAYSLELSKQVRAVNLAYLREPRPYNDWNACNRQGESLVHLATRRGNLELFEFLLHKNAVLMVRDDYGKTPLHEACWSKQPNFEIIQWILTKAPALLFCRDQRGFTPLKYVPRDCYPQWTEFLERNKASLRLSVQLLRA